MLEISTWFFLRFPLEETLVLSLGIDPTLIHMVCCVRGVVAEHFLLFCYDSELFYVLLFLFIHTLTHRCFQKGIWVDVMSHRGWRFFVNHIHYRSLKQAVLLLVFPKTNHLKLFKLSFFRTGYGYHLNHDYNHRFRPPRTCLDQTQNQTGYYSK